MDTRSSSSSVEKRFFTQWNYEFPCLNEAQLIPDRSPEGAKGRGGREDRLPLSISLAAAFKRHVTGHAQNFWYNSRIECRFCLPPSSCLDTWGAPKGVDPSSFLDSSLDKLAAFCFLLFLSSLRNFKPFAVFTRLRLNIEVKIYYSFFFNLISSLSRARFHNLVDR